MRSFLRRRFEQDDDTTGSNLRDRKRIYIASIEPRKAGMGSPSFVMQHLDVRFSPQRREAARGLQTIRGLLASKSPPADEQEQSLGSFRVAGHGVNIFFRDCTIDADIPVALDDASLVLVDSDVRGLGHVAWAEIAVRRDALGGTRSALIASLSAPLVVSATASERPSKEAEEAAAASVVARAINARRGTLYRVEIPLGQPWEDAILRSPRPREPPIALQVRHFSNELARLLRGRERGVLDHSIDALTFVLQAAIDAKREVDADARAKAHLVLLSPTALGMLKRSELAAATFDPCGYADVWLYPIGEEPFSLIH